MREMLAVIVTIFLGMIAWTDYKTMRIPDKWNLALGICGIISLILEPDPTVVERVTGACCVSIPMFLMTMWIPGAFGGGDIKLSFVMGFYLGWKKLLLGAYFAILFGGVQAVCLLATGKAKIGEGAHMAFGPALCLGFILAKWWGDPLILWYYGLFC